MSSPAVRRPYRIHHGAPPPGAHWLAHFRFGATPAVSDDPRRVAVPLAVLEGVAEESWLSDTPVTHGWQDGLGHAANDTLLFGQLHLPEAELTRLGLERAVFQTYARIEHLLQSKGYPHWLRMWNFLGRINEGEGDAERYRQFSAGRYKALALKAGFERALPAATAIGMDGDGLVIYFLGGRQAGAQVENPRQVSAFAYPRQYGPKSPSFSRATRVDWADGAELFVSGTASVVGHETRHAGDALAQLDETFANLDSLLAEALRDRAGQRFEPESFKLYLRDAALLAPVLARLAERHPATPVTVLRGDICRSDLAIEIEGGYRIAAA